MPRACRLQGQPEFHHDRHALADSAPVVPDFLDAARRASRERLAAGNEPDPSVPRAHLRLLHR